MELFDKVAIAKKSSSIQGAVALVLMLCLSLLLPTISHADGMEGQPSSQLKNAKGKVFSESGEKAPVRMIGKTGNTKAIDDFELAKYQYCGNDADCRIAVNGCCDCANGGTEVAINKDRFEAFRERFDCLHVQCTQVIAEPPCENGVVSCINHRCHYFDDRPQATSADEASTK